MLFQTEQALKYKLTICREGNGEWGKWEEGRVEREGALEQWEGGKQDPNRTFIRHDLNYIIHSMQ